MTTLSTSYGCIVSLDQAFEAASQLRFPWRVHEAAARYIHTFLHRHPQPDDHAITACAALFLASKTEEAPRRLADIIRTHQTIQRSSKPHIQSSTLFDHLPPPASTTSTPSSTGQTNPAIDRVKRTPLKSSPIITLANLHDQQPNNQSINQSISLDLNGNVTQCLPEPEIQPPQPVEDLPEVFVFNSDLASSPIAPRAEEETKRIDTLSIEEEAMKTRVCNRESEILLTADFAFGFTNITPIIIELCAHISVIPHHPSRTFAAIIEDAITPASRKLMQQSFKVFKMSLKSSICIFYTPQCIAVACVSIAAASMGIDLLSIVQQFWLPGQRTLSKHWFQALLPNAGPVIVCWRAICSLDDGSDFCQTLTSTLSSIDQRASPTPSERRELADCWNVRPAFDQLLVERFEDLAAEEAAQKRKAEAAAAALKHQAELEEVQRCQTEAEQVARKRKADSEQALRYPPPPPPPPRPQSPMITISMRSTSNNQSINPAPPTRPPAHIIRPITRVRLPPPIFDSYQPPQAQQNQQNRSSPPPPMPRHDERFSPYQHHRVPLAMPMPPPPMPPPPKPQAPLPQHQSRIVVTKRERERAAQSRSPSRSHSPPPKRSRTSDSRSPSRRSRHSRSRYEERDHPTSRSRERYSHDRYENRHEDRDRYEDRMHDERHTDRRMMSDRDRDRHHRERERDRPARKRH